MSAVASKGFQFRYRPRLYFQLVRWPNKLPTVGRPDLRESSDFQSYAQQRLNAVNLYKS